MKWIGFALLLLVSLVSFWFVSNSRAATETPDYEIVEKDGRFEIRDYPGLRLATAVTKGGTDDSGFMTLFRYIDGGNAADQKIAMTTPVLMERGEKAGKMSFIVPEVVAEKGAPKPKSKNVSLRTLEKARYAVYRFKRSGKQAQDEARALQELRSWIEEKGLSPEDEPLFAYYDPPWTPLFLRRNEVLLPLPRS
jgi:DNA gyrase inhibitor GyrI